MPTVKFRYNTLAIATELISLERFLYCFKVYFAFNDNALILIR